MSLTPQPFPDGPAFTLPPPMPDGTELCLCFQLRAAARRASAWYSAALAPIGLGLPQYSLVGMAWACEKQNGRPPSITELAAALDLDRSTLSRNLKPMETAGLVEIVPGHGRARLVRATAAGRAAYRAGVSLWRAAQDEAKARLGAQQFPALQQALQDTIAGLPSAAGTSAANDL